MLDFDEFSQAISHIYDASMDVARWPDALSLLAKMFDARGAQISVASRMDSVAFITVWGFDEAVMAKLMPRYLELSSTDPRSGLAQARYKAMHCRQVVSDEVLRASAMYNEVLTRIGVEYSMLFSVPIDEEMACYLSVMRGPQQPFGVDDCEDFSRFVPHVGRAVRMHGAFQRCRDELTTVKALLDGVPLGMMVVGDDELQVANHAARVILDEASTLHVQNGRLRGTTRRADADLRDAVDEARTGTDRAIGLALPIDHVQPMRVVVRRLQVASAGMLGAPNEAIALYVTDPRQPVETPEEVLQRLFGLTARQAAVLRVLVDGGDLQSAATKLGIGLETVRSYVKQIMDETGARRQVDLVRMVLSSPAWIASNPRSPR